MEADALTARANRAVRQQGVWWTDSPHIKVRPLSRSHKGTFRNGSFPYGATISATERREIADVVAGSVEGTLTKERDIQRVSDIWIFLYPSINTSVCRKVRPRGKGEYTNTKLSAYQYISIYCYTDTQSSNRRRHRFTAWTATSRRLQKIWQELPHHIDSKIVTNMLVDEMVKCCYSLSIFQIWFIVASVSQPSTIFKNLKHIIASLLK